MQPDPQRPRPGWPALCVAALALAACSGPSDLPPATSTAPADPPALLPLSQLLDQAAPSARSAELEPGEDARAAALRARAAALRGPVIPASERARMDGTISRAP